MAASSPTGSSSSAPTASAAAMAAAASEATDGPTLSVVSKRLRALRKKHNRILQMEESLAGGKKLNKEQEEVLRSKAVVVALIDELERMRAPLAAAIAEELSSRPASSPSAAASSSSGPDSSIEDLLALVYFGSLFDVKRQNEYVATMVARTHERSCCLTYDYVTDDAADILVEPDLDKVSALAALAASRPAAAVGVSHRDALQACAQHARLWLRRANEPIHPDSSITYAAVRAKLDKIMASDYYTAQTETGASVDLSAAVGSYGTGAGVQESMVVPPEAPAVEESLMAEGHKDEKEAPQATEIYNDNQPNVADAQNVDDEAPVNPSEEFSAEVEQEKFEADVEEQDPRNADQQFTSRRPYQNQRGGGRRNYQNGGRGGRGGRGMGGGGYQNGRGGGGGYQNGRGGGGGYYYEPGYYQQRGYSNRGRGGRSGGGNSYYNNQGGGSQEGGHAHSGMVELGANA